MNHSSTNNKIILSFNTNCLVLSSLLLERFKQARAHNLLIKGQKINRPFLLNLIISPENFTTLFSTRRTPTETQRCCRSLFVPLQKLDDAVAVRPYPCKNPTTPSQLGRTPTEIPRRRRSLSVPLRKSHDAVAARPYPYGNPQTRHYEVADRNKLLKLITYFSINQ